MGSDFISDLQGVHQHSLEWLGGANAPMHPPVTAPVNIYYLRLGPGCVAPARELREYHKVSKAIQNRMH